jgi:hypothetical protein
MLRFQYRIPNAELEIQVFLKVKFQLQGHLNLLLSIRNSELESQHSYLNL